MNALAKIDYLLTEVGGARIAIALDLIVAVSEAVPVTPLPLAPPFVAGLVFAVDRVTPQISLRLALELEGGELTASSARSLVVAGVGVDILALEVDRVVAMVAIEPESVRGIDEDARKHPLLTGAFEHNGGLWLIFDCARFVRDLEITGARGPDGASPIPIDAGIEALDPAPPVDSDAGQRPYLLVSIGGETYAVATEDLGEIVSPEALRPMPGAPDFVAGLLDLRSEPMLALSTNALMGAPGPSGPIALVVAPTTGPSHALMIDKALGICRLAETDLFALGEAMAGVSHYSVMEGGRIVGVLSPGRLVGQIGDELRRLTPVGAREAAAPASAADAGTGRKLLSFRLDDGLFAIDLDRVESIKASVRLSPLPGDGNGFDGLADVGDRVVAVRDLRAAFARPRETAPPCILVRLEGSSAGLAVDQVLRIEDVPEGAVEFIDDRAALPIDAVARVDGKLVAILAIDRLLGPPSY